MCDSDEEELREEDFEGVVGLGSQTVNGRQIIVDGFDDGEDRSGSVENEASDAASGSGE